MKMCIRDRYTTPADKIVAGSGRKWAAVGRKFCRKCVFRNNEDSRENVRFCEIEKITMKKSKNAVDRLSLIHI